MENLDSKSTYDPLSFFGFSEAGKAARKINWSQHPLGEPQDWPVSLKTTLGILFNARQAMFLFWGKENFGFYNDGQIPILGLARHPHVMGKTGLEIWPDVWDDFAFPQFNIAMMGQSTWSENQLIPILRSSQMDDGYFSYGYSPVYVEDGSVGGAIVTCVETTGKVLAERNLKENEERLKITLANVSKAEQKIADVLESMSDGFIALDKDFKILRVNKNQEQISGLDRTQTVGKNHWDIWPKETIPKIWDAYHKVIREQVPVYIEDFNSQLNIWIAAEAFPTTENGIAVFFRDITVQKLATRALEESVAQFQTLANSIPQLAWMAKPDGDIFWYNDKWYDYTGTTFEAMQGSGWQSVHNPDLLPKMLPTWKKALATGKPWDDTFQLKSKTGEFRWFLSRALPIKDFNGNITGWFGTNTDVDDALTNERDLVDTLESMSDAFFAIDKNWLITRVNARFEDVVQKKREEQIGHSLIDLCFSDPVYENSVYMKSYRKAMNERVEVLFEDFYEPLNLWTEVRAYPKTDGGLAIFFTDIGERKSTELKLIAAKEEAELARTEAERANNLKSAFLANMSHEIRTPLGVMIGFADLITDTEIPPDDRKQFAQTLKRNGEQLTLLIDDILDLSKVEAGHLKVEVLEFSLRSMIQDVFLTMKVKAQEKNLKLTFKVDKNIDDKLCSDPTRLRQILFNVIGNAVKFTQTGEVTLSIMQNAELLELEVHDTGMGIALEHQTSLFKPFMQADESMTRKFGGTGLGLALSKRLAQLLGGDLTLKESILGKGSTFKLVIKNRLPNVEGRKISAAAIKESTIEPKLALNGLAILLVEDSPDNQVLISRLLTKKGAKVEIAENGLVGIEKALNGIHNLVLMDVQMPVLDGYSATQRLREAGYRKPIIALTAHAMSDVREKCFNLGYSDYLPKPINPSNLVNTIAKYAALGPC